MNYFCTCGRGTETFAVDELQQKFPFCKITHRDGKVFLTATDVICLEEQTSLEQHLIDLRTVERLFITVLHLPDFECFHTKQVAEKLKSSIRSIDCNHWSACLRAWRKLQSTFRGGRNCCLSRKKTVPFEDPSAVCRISCSISERQMPSNSVCGLGSEGRTNFTCVDSAVVSSLHQNQNDVDQTLATDVLGVKCLSSNTVVDNSLATPAVSSTVECNEDSELLTDSKAVKSLSSENASTTAPVAVANHSCAVLDKDQSRASIKRRADEVVTFRVSAKSSGKASTFFTSQELSRFLGRCIAHATGWRPDLRKPELEIYVQLNHDGLIIGLPASSIPLSSRPYLKHAGLRTTIASIMISLAVIQPGMTVLDPMCGEATILVETAKQYPGVLLIGCDINADQCSAAVDNSLFANETSAIHIIQADVADLPLSDASIDAVVCDIPFGMKHGTVEGVRNLLPALVTSLDRVLKSGGRAVLLVGAELKDSVIACVDKLNELHRADLHNAVNDADDFVVATSCLVSGEINAASAESGTVIDNSNITSTEDNTSASVSNTVIATTHTGNDAVNLTLAVSTAGDITTSCQCEGVDIHSSVTSSEPRKPTDTTLEPVDSSWPPCRRDASHCQRWLNDLVHYVKLGEMHAYLVRFTKG